MQANGAGQVEDSFPSDPGHAEEEPEFDGTSWPEGWWREHLARQATQPMALSESYERAVAGCARPNPR